MIQQWMGSSGFAGRKILHPPSVDGSDHLGHKSGCGVSMAC